MCPVLMADWAGQVVWGGADLYSGTLDFYTFQWIMEILEILTALLL